MFSIIRRIFTSSNKEEEHSESEDELWIMIKENSFFRDDAHLVIIDELAESIEGKNLGELDGHSSGAHQLEVNFYNVPNYNKCKEVVAEYFAIKYPALDYTISQEYEATYEKL